MFGLPRLHLGLLVGVAAANLAVWLAPDASTFPGSSGPVSAASSEYASMSSAQIPAVGQQGTADVRLPEVIEASVSTSLYQREVRFTDVPIKRGARWQAAQVQSGDNLPGLFARRGVRRADISALVEHPEFKDQMRRIRTGALIEYQVDETGALRTVRYPLNSLETYVFARAADSFEFTHETRTPERRVVVRRGDVARSLFVAGQRAGLTSQLTLSLAQIFQWDIDFALDIRPGDSFALVYEELYLDGRRVGEGSILAAEFTNQGNRHQAVLYTRDGSQPGYYTPAGRSTRKAFLRAPLEFFRVSSNFNMRRFHPILRTVRPHRGIDYAAPTGTPVWAAGDGKIAAVASDSSSGRHIVLQHGSRYQTKYLHLSRFARGISPGQRVRQGQVIGYVGTTGLSTGPHLHFEFIEGGVHKNPSNANMMEDPISGRDKLRFDSQVAVLMAALEGGPMDTIALARIAGE